jgi:hypothetical protein
VLELIKCLGKVPVVMLESPVNRLGRVSQWSVIIVVEPWTALMLQGLLDAEGWPEATSCVKPLRELVRALKSKALNPLPAMWQALIILLVPKTLLVLQLLAHWVVSVVRIVMVW